LNKNLIASRPSIDLRRSLEKLILGATSQVKADWIGVVWALNVRFLQFVGNSLMPDLFDASPLLHRLIQTLPYDHLEGFEPLDNAALPGAIVANKDSQRGEADGAAIPHGFEVFQSEGSQGRGFHLMSPRSTSR
jgi:hypothetical protein